MYGVMFERPILFSRAIQTGSQVCATSLSVLEGSLVNRTRLCRNAALINAPRVGDNSHDRDRRITAIAFDRTPSGGSEWARDLGLQVANDVVSRNKEVLSSTVYRTCNLRPLTESKATSGSSSD